MAMQLYLLFYATQVSLELENGGVFVQLCLGSWLPALVILDLLFPIQGVCSYHPSAFLPPCMLLVNTAVWTAIAALTCLSLRKAGRCFRCRRNHLTKRWS